MYSLFQRQELLSIKSSLTNVQNETKNENQLPKGATDSRLAEDFTDFFLDKIDKIREGFTNIQVGPT